MNVSLRFIGFLFSLLFIFVGCSANSSDVSIDQETNSISDIFPDTPTATIGNFHVFGDALSDSGNLFMLTNEALHTHRLRMQSRIARF